MSSVTSIFHILSFSLWYIKERIIKKLLLFQLWNFKLFYAIWRSLIGVKPIEQNKESYSTILKRETRPLVSFVLFVDNSTPFSDLKTTITSFLNQLDPSWEAYIHVDQAFPNMVELKALVSDERIRLETYEVGNFSKSFEESISKSSGDFICWPLMGGAFSPQAVCELAHFSVAHPSGVLFFYDEDELSGKKTGFVNPLFKPQWSPELLFSVNYVRGAFFKRSYLVEHLQEWESRPKNQLEIALSFVNQNFPIIHIPHVLFHSKKIRGFSQSEVDSIEKYLNQLGKKAPKFSSDPYGKFKISWKVEPHKVSIIIPTKENLHFLKTCISSIRAYNYPVDYEIIVVDTGSKREETIAYYESLQSEPWIKICYDTAPFNYSRANNIGASIASGDIFLFLNNDIEVINRDWLGELVQWTEYPGVGIVGSKLLFPDRKIQHAGIIVGLEGHASHIFYDAKADFENPFGSIDWYRNYLAVTGACLMVKRDIFFQVGGFDEKYHLVFSDVDICLKVIENGYRIVYNPFSVLIHYEGKSRAKYIPNNDIQLGFKSFYHFIIRGDPYFHPALSYSVRQPVFAWFFEDKKENRLRKILGFANSIFYKYKKGLRT